MKNYKKILSALVVVFGLAALNPVQANAAWKQNNTGWWYTQVNSYAIGWNQIDGKWYYFETNGYMKIGWINDNGTWYYCFSDGSMASNCYVDQYYLNSTGAWVNTENSTNFTSTKALELAQQVKIEFYDGTVTYHVDSVCKIDNEMGEYYNKPYYNVIVTRDDTNESIGYFRIYEDGNFIV